MSRNVIWIIFIALVVERFMETVLPDKIKKRGEVTCKWFFNYMLIVGILIYLFIVIEYAFIVKNINLAITFIGVVLVILRIILKIWVVKTLGKFWSIQIEIREDQKLIKEGPYRFMRHPSYFSTIIEATAGPLIFNAYFTLIFVWIVYIPLLLVRIYLEEKELVRYFGKKYENYKKEVYALLPLKIYKGDDL